MPAGLQVWDATGHLIFDTPDRMGRIVGWIDAAANNSGSTTQSISIPTGCTPFWFALADLAFYSLPDVTMTNTSITYGHCGPCRIFYGYY